MKIKSKADAEKKLKIRKDKLCKHGQYYINGKTPCCPK